MKMNERNDFFESEPVKQLLAENYAAGYIYLRFNDVEFCDDDVTDSLYNSDDRCFIVYKYVERMCQFIDDVVNDRFDMHTLEDVQFDLLYKHFIEKHLYSSLLNKIKAYYFDTVMARTIYVLPNYFTFKPKLFYYLDEMNADEAYTKLCDAIEVAKTYELLERSDAEQVFQGKIKQVADERKKIKELSK
jgi:hypothetical protein